MFSTLQQTILLLKAISFNWLWSFWSIRNPLPLSIAQLFPEFKDPKVRHPDAIASEWIIPKPSKNGSSVMDGSIFNKEEVLIKYKTGYLPLIIQQFFKIYNHNYKNMSALMTAFQRKLFIKQQEQFLKSIIHYCN